VAGYILRGEEKSIVLKAPDIDRLLRSGNGDAALLFLCLQRANRGLRPEELKAALGFSDLRLSQAETALQEMGLLPGSTLPVPVETETPEYTTDDISQLLDSQNEFRLLCDEVDRKLGYKMNVAHLKALAGLYDGKGLPADVIYTLVSHCVERYERSGKKGLRPTMFQIEKEGYRWAEMGIFSMEAADRYLQQYARKHNLSLQYMAAMGLGNRAPVGRERTYLEAWLDMGFDPDAVALAYERTMSQLHELKMNYMNGILKKWHTSGWHSAAQVLAGEKPVPTAPKSAPAAQDNSWMRQYAGRKRR